MADAGGPSSADPAGAADQKAPADGSKVTLSRRSFLVGAGAGAATASVVLGGAVATKAISIPSGAAPAPIAGTAAGPLDPTMRRVTLNVDSVKHDVIVDNRESLWETMTYQLGLSNSNLGCDRAQCGACAVLVDGKAVNSCSILSSRLGRGQAIATVAGLATGTGVAGLHPIQRSFWLNGGFQCGICTRGFIMSTVALLKTTPNPTDEQIAEGLSGNICRCGEYAKIFTSVKVAAAEMRGEKVSYLAAPVVVDAAQAAAPAAAIMASKDFEFAAALATIEDLDPIAEQLKGTSGIVDVSGSERTITVKWDPAKFDEAKIRALLAGLGHAVK